jgi:hypothetical protein
MTAAVYQPDGSLFMSCVKEAFLVPGTAGCNTYFQRVDNPNYPRDPDLFDWHPAYWFSCVVEDREQSGEQLILSDATYIVDDFGSLVEVAL